MPRKSKAIEDLSPQAIRTLRQIGEDLRAAIDARETYGEFADRCFMHRHTLRKALEGDPNLSIGIYISVLEGLGLLSHLDGIGSPEKDELGQTLRLGRVIRPKDVHLDNDF